MSKELADEKKQVKQTRPSVAKTSEKERPAGPAPQAAAVLRLQKQVGNQAVQRLLAQRKGGAGFDLDQDTAARINQARSGGQSLDGTVQKQMSDSLGYDFSNVRVHTSPESDQLNQQLGAKAFTTGSDIFFKQGAYDPGSNSGRELIAHELTHVVQQGTGRVEGGGSGMTVRPAGDSFEQEADALARQAAHTGGETASQPTGGIQRQAEEEELQMKSLQRQEEEEELQMQAEEEELQMKADGAIQRQEEEEELQMQSEEEEEELQMQPDETIQRQEEEEELQM
jgi:hypothetical protein